VVVRIISKSYAQGKYYLKKVTVEDVFQSGECTVLFDGRLLEVDQHILETVIPETGSKVMIVLGEMAGKVGKLLSKSNENGKKRVIVQLQSDLSVHSFDLDSVTQYTGLQQE